MRVLGSRPSSTRSSSLSILMVKGIGAMAALVATSFATRVLSVSDFGAFGQFAAAAVLLGTFADAGQRHILTKRFAADDFVSWRPIRRALTTVILVGGAAGLLWSVADPAEHGSASQLVAAATMWGILTALEGGLVGLGYPLASVSGSQATRPTVFCLATLAVWNLGTPSLHTIIDAYLFGLAVAVCIVATRLALVRRRSEANVQYSDRPAGPSWIRESISFSTLNVLSVLGARLDVIFLGWLSGPAAVAPYFNASIFAILPQFALSASNANVLPSMLRARERGDVAAMQGIATSAVQFSVLLSVPLAAVGLAAYITLVAASYAVAGGTAILVVLLTGQIISACAGCCGSLLTVTGYQKLVATSLVHSTFIFASVAAVLVQVSGGLGVAIAAAISVTYWNVKLVTAARSVLDIDTSILSAVISGSNGTRFDHES